MKGISLVIALIFAAEIYSAKDERPISLNLEGADVRTVIRAFAEFTGKNIIATKNVSGTVTVKFSQVPWRDAFNAILETNGLTWIEEEGIIKVMTFSELQETYRSIELETKIYRIKFSKADKLEPVIAGILSPRGKTKVESRTNSVVVTDIPTVLKDIEKMIDELDTPTPQVFIQAKLVQVDYGVAREFGIQWSAMTGQKAQTDLPPTKVELTTPATTSRANVVFGKLFPDFDLDAVLQFLEDENKANLLSQPSILVADNEEAMILSGQKVPIVTRDFAGNQIIQFYDVALKLTVTPHISPDGQIVMELHPEISELAGEAPGAAGPVISSQEAKTKLTVNDGETVVIGGIIKDKVEKVREGIPILSKIPILSYFFSHTKHKVSKSELMIFVTPKAVGG